MPRSNRHRRLLGCLASLTTAGCGNCGPEPPPPPEVDVVIVRPGTILAEPQSEFTLEAIAKGKYGVLVDLAAPGLSVEWSGPAGVLANAYVNPVTVSVPDEEHASFTLTATVKSTGGASTTSNVVTVVVSPRKGSAIATELDTMEGTSDWVDAEHVAKGPPGALLVQGAVGTTSVHDWALGVVGHVRLGRNLEPPSLATQLSESTLFARERYVHLRPPSTAAGPWTAGADEIPANPMQSGGSRYLSVRVGVADTADSVGGVPIDDWVAGQVGAALALLERNRAGVELMLLDVFEHGLVNSAGNALPAEPESHCAAPQDVATDWASDEAVLYLVYVPDILLWPTSTSSVPEHRTGWACLPSVTGTRNRLVFLSMAETFPATLAHELGHVLALTASNGAGGAGHVNGLSGFDIANIMWDATGLMYGSTRAHLTLGQLYRMNADVDSWLNWVSPPAESLVRDCTTTSWGACPALAADLEG
jgi:hypothetical protein